MEERLYKRLEYWKSQLIDTSRRNRLLYFRVNVSNSLPLIAPEIEELYHCLVVREQKLQFYPQVPVAESDVSHHPSDALRAGITDRSLNRTLYGLRQKYRTAQEEQGVNSLFLVFGLLEWKETNTSDVAFAPLVIVPVELDQAVQRGNYTLNVIEEDPLLNPTLRYKLKTDFGIALPELKERESFDLRAYFEEVEKAVATNLGWRVLPEAHLGIFSFDKMTLWDELNRCADAALAHPIIRALAGDPSRLPPPLTNLPSASTIDLAVAPSEMYQPLDADSSQQEAIQAARMGMSFILQGPPGTGKSQTIANIIAERLAENKKVLFVSAKRAALEVVYERLVERGLGEFCLQAHSQKANKRDVVQQLAQALQPTDTPAKPISSDYRELRNLREELNSYVRALHQPNSPLQRSAYQVYAELAALHDAPDLTFDYADAFETTPERISKITVTLSEMTRTYAVIEAYREHPWYGVSISRYAPHQTKGDIRARFGGLEELLAKAESQAAWLAQRCGVEPPISLVDMERFLHIAELASRSPRPPASWFEPNAIDPLIDAAYAYQSRFANYHARRLALMLQYEESFLGLPLESLTKRLSIECKVLLEQVLPATQSPADMLLQADAAARNAIIEIAGLLLRLQRNAASLSELCGMPPPTSLAEIEEQSTLAKPIAEDPRPLARWFDRVALLELEQELTEAEEQGRIYQNSRDYLRPLYSDNLFQRDILVLYDRFLNQYSSGLRVAILSFHRDMRMLQAERKSPAKLTYEEVLNDLNIARQMLEAKTRLEAKADYYQKMLGRRNLGLNTDWAEALRAVHAVRNILDYFGDSPTPDTLQGLLINSGSSVKVIRERLAALEADYALTMERIREIRKVLYLDPLPFTKLSLLEADVFELAKWFATLTAELQDMVSAWETIQATRSLTRKTAKVGVKQTLADMNEAKNLLLLEEDVAKHAESLREGYGSLFTGMTTVWDTIVSALDWTSQTLDLFGSQPPQAFLHRVCSSETDLRAIADEAAGLRTLCRKIDEERAFLYSIFSPVHVSVEGVALEQAPLARFRDWLQVRVERIEELDDWMRFEALRHTCQEVGLTSFLETVCREKPAASSLKPAFFKRFYSLWLDELYRRESVLANFDGGRHTERIQRFRELDKELIRNTPLRLRERLQKARPRLLPGGAPSGEMGVLLRESKKRSRLKPLRVLFQEIPSLLLALRPCLMMSPLSVAAFLDPTSVRFDTVIFDEASQVCSEDAIGAIMRGKQIIVVGDSKQLPPTRFFASLTDDNEEFDPDTDDGSLDRFDSILDECASIGLPEWMLRWHYRSRCESLIAFSNRYIYDNRLVTFPAIYRETNPSERCVRFVYVPDGVYVRGGGTEAGTNRIEAERVAELVLQHYAQSSELSLGVIAFSERQAGAIDEALRDMLQNKPEFRKFFLEEVKEPFFVKNLENVQGDERDCILFSLGYGRDQNRKLTMNFGPLNRIGGERRLNVAVTRAKHRVTLVASILPQEIEVGRDPDSPTGRRGLALLKSYMEFAQNGLESLQTPTLEVEEVNVQEQIASALQQCGWEVVQNVGSSGCQIDLAVLSPDVPTKYLAAIECDGTNYTASPSSRDRDRLRHQALEALGWKGVLLRVWSADWVRDRERELARILHALEAARLNLLPKEPTLFDMVKETETAQLTPSDSQILLEMEQPPSEPTPSEPDSVENMEVPVAQVQPYALFKTRKRGSPGEFFIVATNEIEKLSELLVEVVTLESPIHIVEATRRLADCWGLAKSGSNLVRFTRNAARYAEKQGKLEINDDFLWMAGMIQPPVRCPVPKTPTRAMEHIALEEIAEACAIVAREAFSVKREELLKRVARVFGYTRIGSLIRERLVIGLELCKEQGRIVEEEENLRFVGHPN